MRSSAGQVRAVLGAVRPAEWVVLLFLLYMSRFNHEGMVVPAGMPRSTIAAVLVAVAFVQRLRNASRPWPQPSTPGIDRFRVWAPRLVPAIAGLGFAFGVLRHLGQLLQAEGATAVVFALTELARDVIDFGLPAVVLAQGLALHLKTHGRLLPVKAVTDALGDGSSLVRGWLPPVVMLFLYGLMSAALQNLPNTDMDSVLAAFDRAVCFGHDPVQAMQHIASPAMSEWMAFSYMAYLPMYPICFATLFVIDRRAFDETSLAITLCLALGFIGYTIVPARGPMFSEHFDVALNGYYLENIKEQLMDKYRAPRDCFPSLHTAVTLLFLIQLRGRANKLFWGLVPMVATIPVACLYLRYHYLSDVLAGTALAVICAIACRAFSRRQAVEPASTPAVTGSAG